MRKTKVQKTCAYCKEEYWTLHVRGKYCSKICADNSRIKYKECVVCKNSFRPKDRRTLTCSLGCYSILKRKDLVRKECPICGTNFTVPQVRKETAHFCSDPCYRISRRTGKKPNCNCSYCESSFYKAPSLQEKHDYHFCSRLCMSNYYSENKLFSGKNSPTWGGGKKSYYGQNWHSQRRNRRKIDKYTCQNCGKTEKEYGQELSVHHIIPFIMFDDYRDANQIDNLISVCEPCHRQIHSGDNHHTRFKQKWGNSLDTV